MAGYNLGLLQIGANNIPANVRSTIEATNTVEGSQNTNVAGGTPPDGSVTVSTTITDPDGVPGTGDETGTDASFSVTYNNLNWTAAASGTIDYRQQSIATWPATAANNSLLINALIGGIFNVQFRCAPGTVTPPDPGTVALIDPAPSFDTTLIQAVEPQRQISINDVSVAEGNSGQTPAQFTVSLNAASANPVTVNYATANGTATAPGDYASATGTVTFAPGDTSETVTVQVNGDTAVEPNETFNVNLSGATGNAAIADGTGVGTITNDDVAGSTISINDVSVAEGNSGQTPAQFTVSLSAPQAAPVTVAFATANGTAVAPGDYASATGTVTFAPGDTSETVTVQVNGDTAVEPNETFNVNLSGATGNATIADGTGVGTITNDDVAAGSTISINDVSVAEGNSGQTPAQFTVSLSAPQAAPVTVAFATANGTAVAPGDYASATGTVTFAPNDTSETVTVQVNGDTA
ncbi:MAG: Calx-beta domain-containing protein, partial [Solirubrobacterales bacterium]